MPTPAEIEAAWKERKMRAASEAAEAGGEMPVLKIAPTDCFHCGGDLIDGRCEKCSRGAGARTESAGIHHAGPIAPEPPTPAVRCGRCGDLLEEGRCNTCISKPGRKSGWAGRCQKCGSELDEGLCPVCRRSDVLNRTDREPPVDRLAHIRPLQPESQEEPLGVLDTLKRGHSAGNGQMARKPEVPPLKYPPCEVCGSDRSQYNGRCWKCKPGAKAKVEEHARAAARPPARELAKPAPPEPAPPPAIEPEEMAEDEPAADEDPARLEAVLAELDAMRAVVEALRPLPEASARRALACVAGMLSLEAD
jgi:hypothetical protein